MIFLGGGSLLSRAVYHALEAGLDIKLICCPFGDPALPRLKKTGAPILETKNPNRDLPEHVNRQRGTKVFSTNNKFVLDDHLLELEADFFNIHNGLIQMYRGIAEICVFAALCNAEGQYGVTLHKMMPRQQIDAGPVVAQLAFEIGGSDNFDTVMKQSLALCEKIFKNNIETVVSDEYKTRPTTVLGDIYNYSSISSLCSTAQAENLSRASYLGAYTGLFPRLKASIDRINAPP